MGDKANGRISRQFGKLADSFREAHELVGDSLLPLVAKTVNMGVPLLGSGGVEDETPTPFDYSDIAAIPASVTTNVRLPLTLGP